MTSEGYLGRLVCLRCGRPERESAAFDGCPSCVAESVPVALRPDYHFDRPVTPQTGQRGIFAWRAALPLRADAPVVSLAEGNTPLLDLRRLGPQIGLNSLLVKDESRNPTWSWKDRLAAAAVSKAAAEGADTVIVSTTGNHGAAVAAYAAAAGIRCVALTLTSVPATMRTLMQVYGGRVFAYRSGPERWAVMAEAVAKYGWTPMSGFHAQPVGSNPFGVDGYKTIAFELWRDLGRVPDVVVVPTAYADGLAGIYRGFADLVATGAADRIPRLVAAEVFGPYGAALASSADIAGPVPAQQSVAFSIATPVGTYQGLDALRRSGGTTVSVGTDAEIMAMQARVAASEGLYLEASSVVALIAAQRLADSGWVLPEETVVAIATSSGLKDVGATSAGLPEPAVLPANLPALCAALDDAPDIQPFDGERP